MTNHHTQDPKLMSTTTLLIRDAQKGDDNAREALFTLIYREHLRAFTHRYRSRNVLVDEADIESEFMLGALKALDSVVLDRGNPLLYILWKGNMAVAHLLRTRIQKGVKAFCRECKATRAIKTIRGKPTCRSCGSLDLDTYMVVDAAEGLAPDGRSVNRLDSVAIDADTVWGTFTHAVQVAEIQSRLNGRVRELFDILVVEEVNRDSSQNYIREIADRWGVTTACVAVYLRKLRGAIEAYLSE